MDDNLSDNEEGAGPQADAGPSQPITPSRRRATLDLEENEWGEPILPADVLTDHRSKTDLDHRKHVIRTYVGKFWSKFANLCCFDQG